MPGNEIPASANTEDTGNLRSKFCHCFYNFHNFCAYLCKLNILYNVLECADGTMEVPVTVISEKESALVNLLMEHNNEALLFIN